MTLAINISCSAQFGASTRAFFHAKLNNPAPVNTGTRMIRTIEYGNFFQGLLAAPIGLPRNSKQNFWLFRNYTQAELLIYFYLGGLLLSSSFQGEPFVIIPLTAESISFTRLASRPAVFPSNQPRILACSTSGRSCREIWSGRCPIPVTNANA